MRRTVFATIALAFILPLTAQAQQWTDEETEVWDTIRGSWEKNAANDHEGFMADLHPDMLGWTDIRPIPVDRATVERATRFSMEQAITQTLFWEIQPAGMQIIGEVAITYYFHRRIFTDADGKRQTSRTRLADTLVKSGNRWMLAGWYSEDVTEN